MKFINKIGGYDSSLLESVPEFERLRLEALAILLLIPTLTGFFAMFLMLDSYKESSGLSVGMIFFVSLIWAMIVFLIDRALFIFPKKSSYSSIKKYVLFGIRLVISFTIGFTISHSLLVYMNKGEIDNFLQKGIEQKVEDTTKVDNTRIKNIDTLITQDENTIRKLQEKINTYQTYLNAEVTGDKIKVVIDDKVFTTSGKLNSSNPDKNTNTKAITNSLQETKESERKIRENIENQKKERSNIEKRKYDETENIKQNYVKDYSVRSEIMYKVAFKDLLTSLHSIAWFLLILVVDVIAIMLKTFFPFGIYDNLIEKTEEKFEEISTKWVKDDSKDAACIATLNNICQKHDKESSIVTKKVVASGFITGVTLLTGIKYWTDILGLANKVLDFLMKLFS